MVTGLEQLILRGETEPREGSLDMPDEPGARCPGFLVQALPSQDPKMAVETELTFPPWKIRRSFTIQRLMWKGDSHSSELGRPELDRSGRVSRMHQQEPVRRSWNQAFRGNLDSQPASQSPLLGGFVPFKVVVEELKRLDVLQGPAAKP